MTAATITAIGTCSRCSHASHWHQGAGHCVLSGCRCLRLYVPSSFEQLPTGEAQEARLTAVGYPPRQQGEDPELDKALGGAL